MVDRFIKWNEKFDDKCHKILQTFFRCYREPEHPCFDSIVDVPTDNGAGVSDQSLSTSPPHPRPPPPRLTAHIKYDSKGMIRNNIFEPYHR